jgi:hypothetical protein
VLRRGIIAKYVAVRSHYGIILPQMGQTRDEALEYIVSEIDEHKIPVQVQVLVVESQNFRSITTVQGTCAVQNRPVRFVNYTISESIKKIMYSHLFTIKENGNLK